MGSGCVLEHKHSVHICIVKRSRYAQETDHVGTGLVDAQRVSHW